MQLASKPTATVQDTYLADHAAFEQGPGVQDPRWLRDLRTTAIARFGDLGFPTPKDEDWKYTNVAPIVQAGFRSGFGQTAQQVTAEALNAMLAGAGSGARLVFVDGAYSEELSCLPSESGGLTVRSVAASLQEDPQLVRRHLAQLAPLDGNGFTALNTAFIHDGAFVHVRPGGVLEEPIHLLFVSSRSAQGRAAHPRVLIVLENGATATVVESYLAVGHSPYFTNAVTEASVGAGANLTHYKIMEESAEAFHVGRTHVLQERDSVFTSFSVALGARLGRNDLNVVLDAEGAECSLNGLYLAGGSEHIDNHTAIYHAQPHGTSRQRYKGILDGRARAVFNGKVVVRPGAQQTDAQQTNRNLLLSTEASVDTKPQLEIFADDVKCTHGAAVGQLDENMTFYLKSRGLSEETARRLLTYGFASEVIDVMKVEPIREHLHEILMARLGA